LIKNPNESQKQAIEYLDGPLLILAGPGSGKTFTITEKVVNLTKNIKPDKILALTFSEKAAKEMLDRIEEKIGKNSEITVSTFHAFCYELIKEFALDIGISKNPKLISKEHACVFGVKNIDSFGFETIKVSGKPYDLISRLIEGISQFYDFLISPNELEDYIVKELEKTSDPETISELNKLHDLSKFYMAYEEYKRKNDLIDYDDMVAIACKLLENNPVIQKQLQNRFDYILVDEFQDTNYSQLYLINMLTKNGNLTCVADDDQCIYQFRGAYLTNISQLEEYYPNLKKIGLEVNYRSTENIVNLSQELIKNNEKREKKNILSNKSSEEKVNVVSMPDDYSEAEWVSKEVQNLIKTGLSPKDIFILTRKTADGKKFSDSLKGILIPSEYIGNYRLQDFPVIKDTLAYISVISDPFNSGIDFKKIFTREGLSEHDIQKINKKAKELTYSNPEISGDGLYYILEKNLSELNLENLEIAKSIFENINELLIYKKNHLPSDTLKHLLIEKTDIYKLEIHQNTLNSRKNIELLNSLISLVEEFESVRKTEFEEISEYLNILSDFEVEQEDFLENDTVKIMTIHQSKGKEAKAVFVCDVSERHLPLQYRKKEFTVPLDLQKGIKKDASDEKKLYLEEELRLLYVAMTRAKDKLYLTYPKIFSGNKKESKPSVFLEGISYLQNEKVNFFETEKFEKPVISVETPINKKISEYERLVIKYSVQKQYKKAIESIITLAKINELEKSGNLSNFDLNDFLKVDIPDISELSELLTVKLPPLVDKSMKFSASKIKQYIGCPLNFKYNYVLNIPTPKKAHLTVGTDVHKIFEDLGILKNKGEIIDLELAKSMLSENLKESSFNSKTEFEEEYSKSLKMVEYWFDFESKNKNKILATEEKFNLDLCGFTFTGIIDRVDETPNGEYIIIDYKTGKSTLTKPKMAEDVQMALYAMAVFEKYGKYPVKMGQLYVNPDVSKDVIIDVNPANIENIKENVISNVKKIMDEEFTVINTPKMCYYCDYKDICEYLE
jgi:DNA helicase-2/ATP-dependent DNA helicase PcrA